LTIGDDRKCALLARDASPLVQKRADSCNAAIDEWPGRRKISFVFDYVSVNTFWTIVLIVHALLAVATLGALTHQAVSVAMPVRRVAGVDGFLTL
jgi:hypothetical protein